MAIETENAYYPKHKYPIWPKITTPQMNDYTVGNKYDIRIEDKQRQRENGGAGPYNYAHEAILIHREDTVYGKVPPIIIAFASNTKSATKASKRLCPGEGKFKEDDDVVLLLFARLDVMKDVVEGEDIIPGDFSKEDVEGNGLTMSTEN